MIIDDVIYRPAIWKDISGLVELDKKKWRDLAAGFDKWESRMRIFPEGVLVAEYNKKIVGTAVAHIVDYPEDRIPSWEEITDNGYIRNHNLKGNKFYGVNFTVDRQENKRVAFNIHEYQLNSLVRERGLPFRVGHVAPFVSDYKNKYGVDKLSKEKVEELARNDPVIESLYFKLGFELIQACEDYFIEDKKSDGWGLIFEVE